MTTYKEISGQLVRSYTSDPDNPQEGQMWYNQTSLSLRGVQAISAWSSGSPTTEDKPNLSGGAGTQTAALVAGGAAPASTVTNEYNGTGWSTGGALNNGGFFRNMGGTQTAGFCFGNQVSSPDFPTAQAETYDGSTWTSITNIPQVTSQSAAFGSATAGVVFAGRVDNGDNCTNVTSEWDGAAWTTGGTYPQTSRQATSAPGSPATDGIAMGGILQPPGVKQNQVSSYNGTAWSAETSLPVARNIAGGAGSGSTDALIFAGYQPPGIVASSQKYDGTSWTTDASMATGRSGTGGSGSTSAAIASAGNSPGSDNLTEEYNLSASVITPAAWSSGGNLINARAYHTAAGTQTAGLGISGYIGPPANPTYTPVPASEEYDGSAWTAGGAVNTGRYATAGSGTQTAGLLMGGDSRPPGTQFNSLVEEYNGTSWTGVNALPAARTYGRAAGIQTATWFAGGGTPPSGVRTTDTFEYDGTNWTAGGALPTATNSAQSLGTLTAGLYAGGNVPARTASAYEYDGSTWTTQNSLNNARNVGGAGGTQTDGLIFGGSTPTQSDASSAERYDGTTFSTAPSLGTGRNNTAGGQANSSSGDSFLCGGRVGASSYQTATEEFTGETVTANPASNLSVS